MENTLLLSAGFEPIKVISWKKAITLVLLGKVEVLEAYQREIHSPSLTLKLPAVIKLIRYLKPIPKRVKFSRQNFVRWNSCVPRRNISSSYVTRPNSTS